MLVARRLGLDIKGIGTPGHFLVKFEDQLLDPFFAGRDITREECVIRSQELRVYWRDEYLEPINDTFIISRCIRNLIAIYKKLHEFEKAEDATSLLKLV
jgi:regulator of sirC expression with transglutaminase-like and TPR domain